MSEHWISYNKVHQCIQHGEWMVLCCVIRQCIWPQEGPPLPRIKHGKVIIILLTTVISYCIQKSFSYFGEYHFFKKNLCSKTWCFLKLSVYTNVWKCQKNVTGCTYSVIKMYSYGFSLTPVIIHKTHNLKAFNLLDMTGAPYLTSNPLVVLNLKLIWIMKESIDNDKIGYRIVEKCLLHTILYISNSSYINASRN